MTLIHFNNFTQILLHIVYLCDRNKEDLSFTYDINDVVVETSRNSKVKGRKAKGMVAVE